MKRIPGLLLLAGVLACSGRMPGDGVDSESEDRTENVPPPPDETAAPDESAAPCKGVLSSTAADIGGIGNDGPDGCDFDAGLEAVDASLTDAALGACPSDLAFEAEAGEVTTPFVLTEDAIEYTADSSSEPLTAGRAEYCVQVATGADYVLKMRIDAPNSDSNSLLVEIDGVPTSSSQIWDALLTTGFQERTVALRGAAVTPSPYAPPAVYRLAAGRHRLVLVGRESGVRVDRGWLEVATPENTRQPAGELTWSAPSLTSPITLKVTNTNHSLRLDTNKDYVVLLPGAVGNDLQATPLQVDGGLVITGGHHVTMVGGVIQHSIDYPALTGDPPQGGTSAIYDKRQRGAYFKDWTGVLHVEGVEFRGTAFYEVINVSTRSPTSVLQLQNIRIDDPIHAPFTFSNKAGDHDGGDILQTWNGPSELRIDRMTIAGVNYQSFWLQPTVNGAPTPKQFTFKRINVGSIASGGEICMFYPPPCESTRTTAWNVFGLMPRGGVPAAVEDFYIVRDGTAPTLRSLAIPNDTSRLIDGSDALGGFVEFTPMSMIVGRIRDGAPPAGDFVPRGSVGAGYVSPDFVPGG